MSNKFHQMPRFMPYLIIGVIIALVLHLLPVLSCIFVVGLIIGGGLWFLKWLQNYFSPKQHSRSKKKSRIIDYDELP